jgi:predicted Zn-dependent protease
MARQVEELEGFESLPEPGPIPEVVGAWSEATAGATPESRATAAGTITKLAADAGVTAYGSFATSSETVAVANSRDVRAAQSRTTSQLLTVTMGPEDGTGYAEACAVDASTIDAEALGREAVERARRAQRPVEIEPGDYPVVLEEYAVVDILDNLGYLGFSALAVEEGRSFVEIGKRVGSDLVSVWDDGTDPAGLPMAFDYEGVGKERVELIQAGICRGMVFDSETAKRAGRRSTGHGLPAPNPWGPFPLNQFMAAGEASRDELIGGLDRGLLVTRFWYTNPVHPKLVIITGMTRDGTFLVEGGRIVGPVRNMRFTQSYLDAIGGVSAVGRERKVLRGFLGASVVPALRIDGFTFTGVSAG